MDPVEVRRKNFPQPNEFPFKTATGLFYDSGNYQGALDKALKMADYTKLREEQKTARKEGRIMGIGVSTYVEICALGAVFCNAGGRLGERDCPHGADRKSYGADWTLLRMGRAKKLLLRRSPRTNWAWA